MNFRLIGLIILLAAMRLWAAAPATRPLIPALTIGDSDSSSFVADGIVRPGPDGKIAFHVAASGNQQACVLFDPADGTPILFSDEHESLVYDLANSRIVRVPQSRAYVRVDWNAKEHPALCR